MAAIPHGRPVRAPRGDDGDARRQVGHRLAEQLFEFQLHCSNRGGAPPATSVCMWSSAGSVPGGRRAGGRPGSPRAPGTRPRSGGRAGTGRRAARAARPARAAARRGARARRACRRSAARCGSSSAGAAARRRLGVGRGGERSAAAEDEALGQRVRRQPVGAVQAGAGRLADRVQAGDRRAAVEVGRHAAHRVVRRRRDRDQVAARVDARPPRARRRCWGSGHVDRAHVEAHRGLAARAELGLDRQRHLVARGQLVDEALAVARRSSVAPSPRTASVIRNPSRGPSWRSAVG